LAAKSIHASTFADAARWRFDSLKPFLVPGKARSKVEFSTGAYRTLLSMGYDIDSFVNGHLAVSELLGQTSGNGRFVQNSNRTTSMKARSAKLNMHTIGHRDGRCWPVVRG